MVKELIKLGRKYHDPMTGAAFPSLQPSKDLRLQKVVLAIETLKWQILKNASKLKNARFDERKNTYVPSDLTKSKTGEGLEISQ